jgi:hypothetical protein
MAGAGFLYLGDQPQIQVLVSDDWQLRTVYALRIVNREWQ